MNASFSLSCPMRYPHPRFCIVRLTAARGVVALAVRPQTGSPSTPMAGQQRATPTFQYLSYFLCGDAMEAYPNMILDGDRNIGTSPADLARLVYQHIRCTCPEAAAQWGVAASGAASTSTWAWDNSSLHLKNGNLGMADGSVQQATISGLQTTLTNATNNTPTPNPYYNFPQ